MEMKKLTPQQKKIAWIVGSLLIFIHFLPSIASTIRSQFTSSRPAPIAQVRPYAQSVASPLPAIKTPAQDPLAQEFLGRFSGRALDAESLENCQVSLEVKPTVAQTGFYSAYESRSCVPSSIFWRGAQGPSKTGKLENIIEAASPVSTSMSGTMGDSSMNFRIDQVVGATAKHCGPRSYSISSFGTNQIMAQWEMPNPCKGGHMVLVKLRS